MLHRVCIYLSPLIKKKRAHLLVLDSVNISNSELKAPRVSPVIFCSETPLSLRKQVFNRNRKLMEKTLPCGSEEVKLSLSVFQLSYCVAKALNLTPKPQRHM